MPFGTMAPLPTYFCVPLRKRTVPRGHILIYADAKASYNQKPLVAGKKVAKYLHMLRRTRPYVRRDPPFMKASAIKGRGVPKYHRTDSNNRTDLLFFVKMQQKVYIHSIYIV